MTKTRTMTYGIETFGLSEILNATGGWTSYGAAKVLPECLEAARAISRTSVDMDELQAAASRAIAGATGAQSGMVVNCSAAGLVVAVAACIVGADVARAKRLPDTAGLRNRVVLQKSHNSDFSAPMDQMIRMAGAEVDEIGWSNTCDVSELDLALSRNPAAALYVVSYESLHSADLPLPLFIERCKAAAVPAIIDIAGEQDMAPYIGLGADLVIISAHKQLGSLTAGILAGRADLISGCLVQMGGVGRPGKPSKESIASVIAAMHAIPSLVDRNKAALRRADDIRRLLGAVAGIEAEAFSYPVPGETVNVRIRLNAKATMPIAQLARNLEATTPRVILRKEQMPAGYLVLNPRELDDADVALLPELFKRALHANSQA